MADIKLEYVSSGNSALKVLTRNNSSKDLTSECKRLFNLLQTDEDLFSFLFNAYTEENIGKGIKNNYPDVPYKVHADSGGLQMITLGRTVDDEQKNKIYEVQSKFSDVAMCFDEIPVVTAGGKIGVAGMSLRVFDHSLVKEKAKATGKNIRDQVKKFLDDGSSAKAMLILQGNDISSFQEWVNYSCDEIGDYVKYLYGVSVAGSSLGTGAYEDAIRSGLPLLDYPQDLNTKNIHLLGMGSSSRLRPYAALKHLYEGTHISFDSTSHTKSIFSGIMFDRNGMQDIKKMKLYKIDETLEDIYNITGVRITREWFFDVFRGSNKYKEKTGVLGGHCEEFCRALVVIYVYMVKCAQEEIRNEFVNLPKKDNKLWSVYRQLSEVSSLYDFNKWSEEYGKYLPSSRVEPRQSNNNTLDKFF